MPVNRIIRHLDAPPAPPADTRGRYEFVSDAVLRAVAAVSRLLDDDDPAVVLKAAKMILDVEKTRMRHGREVHGAPDPYREETRQMLGPLPSKAIPLKIEWEDDFDDDEGYFDDEPTASRPCEGVGSHRPAPSQGRLATSDAPAEPPDSDDATEDGPSEFQQAIRQLYAERFPDILAKSQVPVPTASVSNPNCSRPL